MLNFALVKRWPRWDYGQVALADDDLFLLLWPFGFSRGLSVESPFLVELRLGFLGMWCQSFGLLPFLRPWCCCLLRGWAWAWLLGSHRGSWRFLPNRDMLCHVVLDAGLLLPFLEGVWYCPLLVCLGW